MSFLSGREKRPNAGNKMASLLNSEENVGDEFYSTIYGGLTDVVSDNDYIKSSSEDDDVDSDFDIDEADEPIVTEEDLKNLRETGEYSNAPNRSSGRGKKYHIFTKAYKETTRSKNNSQISTSKLGAILNSGEEGLLKCLADEETSQQSIDNTEAPADDLCPNDSIQSSTDQNDSMEIVSTGRAKRRPSKSAGKIPLRSALPWSQNSGKGSVRFAGRKRLANFGGKKTAGTASFGASSQPMRRLTQEELLEEAKITEQINAESLAQYQRLEIEKKRFRSSKSQPKGPFIRFHSLAVPDLNLSSSKLYGVVSSQVMEGTAPADQSDTSSRLQVASTDISHLDLAECASWQERTFVTFPSHRDLLANFPKSTRLVGGAGNPAPVDQPIGKTCVITGKKAAYFDPLTQVPYADLAAFRVLRHLYKLYLTQRDEKPLSLIRRFRAGQIHVPGVELRLGPGII